MYTTFSTVLCVDLNVRSCSGQNTSYLESPEPDVSGDVLAITRTQPTTESHTQSVDKCPVTRTRHAKENGHKFTMYYTDAGVFTLWPGGNGMKKALDKIRIGFGHDTL